MNDPVRDLLTRAADLGAPPQGYWTGYTARLRSRLDDEPRTLPWLSPLLAGLTAAAAIAGVVLLREPDAPPRVEPPRRAERVVAAAPTAEPQRRVEVSEAPGPIAVVEKPAPVPPPEPAEDLPVRSIAVDLAEFARPQVAARHEEPSSPPALHLSDFRLLRNGVEIGRGQELSAEPGGMIWFADRAGMRVAISATPQPGFREAGLAHGNLMTFDWGRDRFHWVSASEITPGEMTIWIAVDRIAAVPPTMPPLPGRGRWPSLWPRDPVRDNLPRLQRQLPERRIGPGGEDEAPSVRFGSARSVDELSTKRTSEEGSR